MIVIKIPESNNILQKDVILQKKMISILISLCKQFNNEYYYIVYNFKNVCINIVNIINKIINHLTSINNLCNGINIRDVKLNCVVAISNDYEYETALYGECEDTSIKLTLIQLLYFYLNSIMNNVINCCIKIQYSINIVNVSQPINSNVKQCFEEIKNILQNINNISMQTLNPICEKFNYIIIDNMIHSYITPLLIHSFPN